MERLARLIAEGRAAAVALGGSLVYRALPAHAEAQRGGVGRRGSSFAS